MNHTNNRQMQKHRKNKEIKQQKPNLTIKWRAFACPAHSESNLWCDILKASGIRIRIFIIAFIGSSFVPYVIMMVRCQQGFYNDIDASVRILNWFQCERIMRMACWLCGSCLSLYFIHFLFEIIQKLLTCCIWIRISVLLTLMTNRQLHSEWMGIINGRRMFLFFLSLLHLVSISVSSVSYWIFVWKISKHEMVHLYIKYDWNSKPTRLEAFRGFNYIEVDENKMS